MSEHVSNRASLTTRKLLDLLAKTMVKLKDELRKVRGEMATLREDRAETLWANLSNYANGIQQGKNNVDNTPKAPIASKVVNVSETPVTLQTLQLQQPVRSQTAMVYLQLEEDADQKN